QLDRGPRRLLGAAVDMAGAARRVITTAGDCDLVHLALPTPAFGWIAGGVCTATPTPVVVGFEGHLADARRLVGAASRPGGLRSYVPFWAINNGLVARLGRRGCRSYVV